MLDQKRLSAFRAEVTSIFSPLPQGYLFVHAFMRFLDHLDGGLVAGAGSRDGSEDLERARTAELDRRAEDGRKAAEVDPAELDRLNAEVAMRQAALAGRDLPGALASRRPGDPGVPSGPAAPETALPEPSAVGSDDPWSAAAEHDAPVGDDPERALPEDGSFTTKSGEAPVVDPVVNKSDDMRPR